MSNYRKSSKRRKTPDPNLVEIKSKFDAEFRRFSINRGKYKKFGDFRELILSFFQLDFPFTICYTDPIHGDLLPINNDENYGKAISSVGANVLLRIILQRQEEDLGQLRGYGNSTCAGAANKRKNRLSQYILGGVVPSYMLPNNGSHSLGSAPLPHCTGNGGAVPYGRLTPNGLFPHPQVDPAPQLGYNRCHNGLTIGRPQDFRTVSSIIDVDLVPETQRRVRLVKPPKAQKGCNGASKLYDDRPLGFYIREGTSVRVTQRGLERVPGIFVSRLVPGGIAASTGLLAVDDEVVEVNGIGVEGRSLDQVTDMMIANASDLILTVKPANQATTLRHAQRRRDKPSVKKNISLDQRIPTSFESENVGKAKNGCFQPISSMPYDINTVTSHATPYVNLSDETCKAQNAASMVSSYSSSYASGAGSGSSGSTPSISHYYTPTSEEGCRAGNMPPPIPPRPSVRGRRTSVLAALREAPPPDTPVAMTTPPGGAAFEGHQPTPPPRRRSSAAPPISARSRRDDPSKGGTDRMDNNLGKNHLFRAQSPLSSYPSRVDPLPVAPDKPHNNGRAGVHFIPRRDAPLHHFNGHEGDLNDMFANGMRFHNCSQNAEVSRTENELLFNGDSAFFLHSIEQNEFAMGEELDAVPDDTDASELDDDDVIIYDLASPSSSPTPHLLAPGSEDEAPPPPLLLLNKTIKFSSPPTSPAPLLWDDEYHLVTMRSPSHVTHHVTVSSRDDANHVMRVEGSGSVKKRAPKPPPNNTATTLLCSKI